MTPQDGSLSDKAQECAAANHDRIVDLVAALVRQPTFEPRQCGAATRLTAEAMREAGFAVDEYAPRNPAGETLPVVIGWLGPRTDQPDILLCAHIDTSPPGNGWTRDPFGAECAQGFLFGRGAVVSKSDAAGFIHAAAAAHAQLPPGNHSIAVAITSDEGSGGYFGAAYILDELRLRPAMAIFPGVTDVATIAHNGCVQAKIRISGTACHQSLLPPEEDAMRHATLLCGDLYRLADRLAARRSATAGVPGPTLNVTRIAGGTEFGMAPRDVEIWIDRRVTPEEELDQVRMEIIEMIENQPGPGRTRLSYEVVRLAEPMRPAENQQHFVRLLGEEAQAAYGKRLAVLGSTLYTDARWFSNAGIPTLMYGAGEADIQLSGANGIDERVPLECLRQAPAILARAITRFILERQP